MNQLPRVHKIQNFAVERADYESQFELSLQYSDDQDEWHEIQMDASDATCLFFVTLMALRNVDWHAEEHNRQHIEERLLRVYPTGGADAAETVEILLRMIGRELET